MFKKILIANRGEIACRVAATARKLGVQTVAVYSDADANARHVQACDEALHIGGSAPRDSYLKGDVILAAAKASGAQAIHPGYGFLSENEDFAQACADAGVVFIGPPPAAIKAMGLKAESKQRMEAAGVPLVPGYHGADQDPALLQREADRIGYPVLLKASAGGGGKGMRVVERSADFAAALASCQREARNSFGDDAVLIERYLQKPRHIEIQVFADAHGECAYLFERDCSVQRRHQKVLEEAPAPGMTPERRRQMGEAAVAAAKAVGYVGAGTVEFIAEHDIGGEGRFYFMEMNTRLQVEHPVTEMITGLDLVEWQLRVASGERLPLTQKDLQIDGHAIEARLYAENPANQFLPSIGRLTHLRLPPHTRFEVGQPKAAWRVDSGVGEGDEITPFYDPMIAKLIVWGADRPQALARLDGLLARTEVLGPYTNVNFLRQVLATEAFASGAVDTGLIAREGDRLFKPNRTPLDQALAAAVAALSHADEATETQDPFSRRDGWRLLGASRRWVFTQGAAQHPALLQRGTASASKPTLNGQGFSWCAVGSPTVPPRLQIHLGDVAFEASVVRQGERLSVFVNGEQFDLGLPDPLAHAGEQADEGGRLTAPMPGKIVSWLVASGASVKKGQALAVMEAMKMEHTIAAPADGQVLALRYAAGEQVAEGAELLEFAAA
jgi:3-methylcrotonyl-CoA carboxylase alpha subunit